MKPGIEIPYATFSKVPPALPRDGLATYWPQYLDNVSLGNPGPAGISRYLQINYHAKGDVTRSQETLRREQRPSK